MKRASGILLHVTALPGPHGIGDFGQWARTWVDFLASAKQQYWQILPLGPVGFGNSPYSACSAYAGNPLLINLQELVKEQLLTASDLEPYDGAETQTRVRFERVKNYKMAHLKKAYANFNSTGDWKQSFQKFCDENHWLETFAGWAAQRDGGDTQFIKFQQYLFYKQVDALKAYANQKSVKLIGDLPMYVAEDSADRHEAPELFDLTSGFVAGAPPCNVHPMGQKWGNPLFRWDKHKETGYAWWLNRLKYSLRQMDVVRLDYFCGYGTYWATDGKKGHWRRGPEADLFNAVKQKVGDIPFVAEDLGSLTPEINKLRDSFGILSTKVLHYAFDGQPNNPYVPTNYRSNSVVYTGTHDNDTTKGWFESSPSWMKENVRRTLKCDGRDISWDLMKYAAASKANLMIIQYQDALCLGKEARFNTPGTVSNNNWSWCLLPSQINEKSAEGLAWLVKSSNRV